MPTQQIHDAVVRQRRNYPPSMRETNESVSYSLRHAFSTTNSLSPALQLAQMHTSRREGMGGRLTASEGLSLLISFSCGWKSWKRGSEAARQQGSEASTTASMHIYWEPAANTLHVSHSSTTNCLGYSLQKKAYWRVLDIERLQLPQELQFCLDLSNYPSFSIHIDIDILFTYSLN